MENLFLFLKGLCVGIGKIIPGVSGSLIAAVLNIYEDSIYAINHLKSDFKKSVTYLFPIGCGVFLSTILFSYLLIFLLGHYYVLTMFLFLGLILGTVPKFRKQVLPMKGLDYFLFFFSFLLPFFLSLFQSGAEFVPSYTLSSLFFIMFLGFLEALSMVIPGISGTALFLMLGSYSFILNLFANPFSNLTFTLLFGIGLVIGVFLTSGIVEYCFQKNKKRFLIFVYGLLWSSLIYLLLLVLFQVTWSTFLPVLFFFFLGFFLTSFFS